jgi:hypothetical protein
MLQRHDYGALADTLAVASLEGGGQRRGARVLFNYVNQQRKNLISKLINFILFFIPSQLDCPQNDGIALPPCSLPFTPLLCTIIDCGCMFLAGCCVKIF